MLKFFKKMIYIFLTLILLLVMGTVAFLQHPKFGKHPSKERLNRVKQSPNYKNGSFKNLSFTPDLSEDASYYSVMKEFLFSKKVRPFPLDSLPSVKTNLKALDPAKNVLVWFGHSSYFMQIDGKKFLVDPVFSGAASPLSFTTPAFKGADIYTTDDLPEIDFLLISHDHWDHTDHETLLKLKSKVKQVICGLGVGEHFEYWGYPASKIIEKDWNEEITLAEGFNLAFIPARHFSGRGFKRNQTLWTSYALKTPTTTIFIGGDSGYDTHFAKAGDKYGPFDLALLECGQYDKSWKYIHMQPEEVLKAAKDLKTKKLFPVHNSKFKLGNHAWDEPLKAISQLNKTYQMPLVTPIIGQQVNLKDTTQRFDEWWLNIN